MTRALLFASLVLGLALPIGLAVPPSRATSQPLVGNARTEATQARTWVAKRRKRRRRKPKPPAAPVKLTTPGISLSTLKQGRKARQVVVLKPRQKLGMSLTGAGKLALAFFNVLPRKSSARKGLALKLTIDSGRAKTLYVPTKLNRRGNLKHDLGALVSKPKKHLARLKGGDHTVTIEVVSGALGVAVRVEWYAIGQRKPAPLVLEPASSKMMAAVMDLDDEDEVAPPPPDAPPPAEMEPISLAPPVVPDAPPEPTLPEEVAAQPVPTPSVTPSPAAEIERRIAAGEIRHGLLGAFPGLQVVHTREGDRHTFHQVDQEKSYVVLVAGPGELTIRLHRLVEPSTRQTVEGTPYSIVILENDVVLQQLSGTTEVPGNWRIDSPNPSGLLLSAPKEYHLKVSANQSRLALQISEAPEGMLIRYDYAAETMSLAAMDLGFDDEDEDDEGIGTLAAAPKPTVVMEVAVAEKIIVEEAPSFIGLAVRAGALAPSAGGDPVLAGSAAVRFALPVDGLTVGVLAAYQRHTLQDNVGDLDAVAIRPRSRVDAVPLFGMATYGVKLGSMLNIYAAFGGGVAYMRTSTRARGAETIASGWGFGGLAGAGIELDIGAGWLGIDGSYLYMLPRDFEGTLQNYTPGGPGVALQYRIGI